MAIEINGQELWNKPFGVLRISIFTEQIMCSIRGIHPSTIGCCKQIINEKTQLLIQNMDSLQ
jgi:hypothetical protein